MCIFYGRYISDYSNLACLLNHLLKNDTGNARPFIQWFCRTSQQMHVEMERQIKERLENGARILRARGIGLVLCLFMRDHAYDHKVIVYFQLPTT